LRRRAVQTRKIEQRLGLIAGEDQKTKVLRLWRDGREATTVVYGPRYWQSLLKRPLRVCREAGWDVSGTTLLLSALGTAAGTMLLVVSLGGSPLIAAGVTLVLGIVFWIYSKQCAARRAALFEAQLVDALQIATRSLRAGHPLMAAFHLVAEEIPAPVGTLFAEVCQQQALGNSLDTAILRVADDSTSIDLKLFATSVAIQLRSGGNLAEMMDRLTSVIRERMRLSRRVRVLLAQVQLSKRVLLALPFFLFVVLNIINPGYMTPLYHTYWGRVVLLAGSALLIMGAWIMNRLAVIRY